MTQAIGIPFQASKPVITAPISLSYGVSTAPNDMGKTGARVISPMPDESEPVQRYGVTCPSKTDPARFATGG